MYHSRIEAFHPAFDGANLSVFFNRICHYAGGGSGLSYLSGWILLFCAFSDKRKWQLSPLDESVQDQHFGKMKWSTMIDNNDMYSVVIWSGPGEGG